MSITETTRRAGPFATDGLQTEFAFAFKVFDEEDVVVTSSEGGLATELVLTTDYTVALNADQDSAPGGTVTLVVAPDGPTITLTSGMVATQPTVFTNAGGFFPRVLNNALDRLTILVQQILERLSRVPLLPLGDAPVGEFPVVLPDGSFGWSTGSGTDSGLRADLGTDAPGKGADIVAGVATTADLASTDTGKGDALIGRKLDATGAAPRTVHDKLGEIVSIADFGASEDATAAVNTAAIHTAMKYHMDRFPGSSTFYPAGPGEPSAGGAVDFERRDRRTGIIRIPAGQFRVLPEVFSSLTHARDAYVGFTFEGEDQSSSVLLMECGGVESWFYKTTSLTERYQKLTFSRLTFIGDDYRYTNFMSAYSSGVQKQLTAEHCRFIGFQKILSTTGIGNADLNRFLFCWIEHYSDMLTLDNDQSVQHDFINCEFRSWGPQVRVKQHGGGNVNIKNGAIDLIWDERTNLSPSTGTYLFVHDANANIAAGNCTYKWEDCRIEIEAYMINAGSPALGVVKTVENPTAFPRIILDNINWVNGRTYTIDAGGTITGSGEFRRITAVQMWPGKYVEFRGGQTLKNFFYAFDGSRDTNSPHQGGIVLLANLQDGEDGELPAADSTKWSAHDRATYAGSAGRLITEGLTDHIGGSSFTRKLLDADPRGPTNSFAREPSCELKRVYFKHTNNGWPAGANAGNDHFLDLPPGITDARFYVRKPASGASTDTYQLHLKATDRSGSLIASTAESVSAQFKDEHVIDISHIDLTGISRICLCASGTATGFQSGGIAYIEYV